MNDQGGVLTAAAWPAQEQPVQKLVYDGSLGAIYGIFIKNLLLSIITLTVYRFWGKTNLRRYAWSHMTLQGFRFEYTGRGGELFLGFLFVAVIYGLGGTAFAVITLTLGELAQTLTQLGFFALIIYLAFVAIYAAQNYRLTRTLWCGIRGGMTGSAWRYGVKAFLFTLLNLVTLNLAGPWVAMRLAEDRFNHSYFGNAKANLQASAKPLYLPYILGFVCMIVGLVIVAAGLWFLIQTILASGDLAYIVLEMQAAEEAGRSPQLTQEQVITYYVLIGGFVACFYLGFAVVAIISFAPYAAAQFRQIANNLRLAELRFASEVTALRYIGLWLGNLLWILLTLGLGTPFAIHRTLKFFADRVEIHGVLDTGRLQQNTLDRPKFGEGMLEAFDSGFF
jgi:uncharacterized membrane protein YjgN (DUF898 family)